MRIKKYTGATLQDVTGQMKTELGPDAIILNTRKVHKGGALSFMEKEMFEITAAVETEATPAANSYAAARPARTAASGNTVQSLAEIAEEFRQRHRHPGPRDQHPKKFRDLADLQELKSEVEDIKSTILEIASHLKYSRMPALPDTLKQMYVYLLEQDVDEQDAADLVQAVYVRLGAQAQQDASAVDRQLLNMVEGMFAVAEPEAPAGRKRRVIALVGPTGVGKTTTIAKLAARRKLVDGQSVALVSADTYRIGAIEQLQTFASIADIPLEVVYESPEVDHALRTFGERDVVYIDTVGRSQYRTNEVAEMAEFVNRAKPDEVHLVLSVSTQPRTLMESVDRFSVVNPTRILLTKADEAASFGSLIGLAKRCSLPVSFLTTGQGVPDDIVPARSSDLARMVCKGVIPDA